MRLRELQRQPNYRRHTDACLPGFAVERFLALSCWWISSAVVLLSSGHGHRRHATMLRTATPCGDVSLAYIRPLVSRMRSGQAWSWALGASWALAAATVACATAWIQATSRRKEEELMKQIQAKEKSRCDERAGRIRLEKELRRRLEEDLASDDRGTYVHPIGKIRSCFKCCVGTPRQGLLAPSARASLILEPSISPASLDDLHEFSHVWLTFVFHLNTNVHRNSRALAKPSPGQSAHTFPAKITPPMRKRRVGIFSTRSPHRPNPIGVTLARIERVDVATRTVHLLAVDLVDGTPILDLKPYVPLYDTVPDGQWAVPQWIQEGVGSRRQVILPQEVCDSVDPGSLQLYRHDPEGFLRCVREVLAVDVRSPHQQEAEDRLVSLRLDTMLVTYRIRGGDAVVVEAVREWEKKDEDSAAHVAEALEPFSQEEDDA